MPEKLRELRAMAEECRDMAEQARFALLRERLFEIADQLDRMVATRQRLLERRATRH
jgi:hypothetical protein